MKNKSIVIAEFNKTISTLFNWNNNGTRRSVIKGLYDRLGYRDPSITKDGVTKVIRPEVFHGFMEEDLWEFLHSTDSEAESVTELLHAYLRQVDHVQIKPIEVTNNEMETMLYLITPILDNKQSLPEDKRLNLIYSLFFIWGCLGYKRDKGLEICSIAIDYIYKDGSDKHLSERLYRVCDRLDKESCYRLTYTKEISPEKYLTSVWNDDERRYDNVLLQYTYIDLLLLASMVSGDIDFDVANLYLDHYRNKPFNEVRQIWETLYHLEDMFQGVTDSAFKIGLGLSTIIKNEKLVPKKVNPSDFIDEVDFDEEVDF